MSSLLIRNGTVVTATDRYLADVYIEDETISMIGSKLDVPADREIDASGCYLFPGGIDAHTHMELPFMGTHASDTFSIHIKARLGRANYNLLTGTYRNYKGAFVNYAIFSGD